MAPRSLHVVAAALLGAAIIAASPASAAPKLPAVEAPYPGLDHNGPDRAVEIQSWWVPAFGHIHATLIAPFGGEVKGKVSWPVRVILHSNPSVLRTVWLRMRSGDGEEQISLHKIDGLDLECPYDGTTDTECAFDFEMKFDSDEYPDGWKQIILRAETETPDDRTFRTSSRIPVNFNNGNRSDGDAFGSENVPLDIGCEKTSFRGRGWYGDPIEAYTSPYLLCLPTDRVRGVWNAKIAGGSDASVTRLTVTLSKNHRIPAVGDWPAQPAREGRVIFDREGNFGKPFNLRIDTRGLENGWHTIAIRTTHPKTATSECDYCGEEHNVLEGVAVQWFYVRN